MKEGHQDTVQFKMLERALSRPRFAVTGILEELKCLGIANCQRGNIGRFSNEEIGVSIGYDGDIDELIRLLTEHGYLEEHPEYRLVLCDWPSLVPDYVHIRVARATEYFCDGTKPKTTRLTIKERETIEAKYAENGSNAQQAHGERTACTPPITTHHNPSEPIRSKPNPSHQGQDASEGNTSGEGTNPDGDGNGISDNGFDGNGALKVLGVDIPPDGIPDYTPSGKRASFVHATNVLHRKHKASGSRGSTDHRRGFAEIVCIHLGGSIEGEGSSLGRVIKCCREHGRDAVQHAAAELLSEGESYPQTFQYLDNRCKKHITEASPAKAQQGDVTHSTERPDQ